MVGKRWIVCGSILAALGVALGAFGAHGLKPRLEERFSTLDPQRRGEETAKALDQWRTAAGYHLIHAIGIVVAGVAAAGSKPTCRNVAVSAFLAGIGLFSGGLYGYVLGGPTWMVHVVPFGGGAFIAGWLALAWSALRG
jgi:uncharacterized membrane protein YgdD (TMEM256/DUF423 family)